MSYTYLSDSEELRDAVKSAETILERTYLQGGVTKKEPDEYMKYLDYVTNNSKWDKLFGVGSLEHCGLIIITKYRRDLMDYEVFNAMMVEHEREV